MARPDRIIRYGRKLPRIARRLDKEFKKGVEDLRKILPLSRGGSVPSKSAPRDVAPLPQTSRSPESYAREAQLVSGLRDVGRVISDIPIPSFRQRTTGSEQVTPREVIREVVNNPSIEITPEMLPIINDVAILMDSNGDLFEDGFANQFRRDKLLPKKKRKKSKYQVELGKQLKMLKKKHPRTPVTRLMKKAHAATRKALGMRKRSTRKGQVRKTARRAYER